MQVLYWNFRRWNGDMSKILKQHINGPVSYLGPLLMANIVWNSSLVPEETSGIWAKTLVIVLIIIVAWLLLRVIDMVADIIREQFDIKVEDNLDERKILTQLQYIRRVSEVVLFVIALALILLQFEGVRKVGTGILTSAGVLGIIVGFAAQRSIANLLAGFQIAFTQPIRIDDVVIVEGEWGRVEEITLTYVVIKIWDQRRLVVPLQYFIDKTFQNWTRTTSELLGTVFLYVDYTFPVEVLRRELTDFLENHRLWDQRVGIVQVTDSKPDVMEIRLLVSATNAGNAFDLRCEVREHMINFIQQEQPESLPKMRMQYYNDLKDASLKE
ncbi:mechanosensitive ion channel protein MscS [Flavilitoribacter nigricans DSM 23189 = NBRC 102662]|uniref:Mechanosensitive ion channel protein MscS n=2 Tax=Flavilitoribacter TaxID=2762562 RepID=A0A2D0NEM8_FLAN2|nr:mechanosensitive ion channel protein MscS [Flavilitoribacter nigricans DSM 23189 = NBRC 102662]